MCLDTAALRRARVPLDAPLCLRAAAWESDVELPEEAPEPPEFIVPGLAYVEIVGPLAKSPDTLCGWYDGYQGETGIAARFERAVAAAETRAVLVYFETPGGTSAGLEDAIAFILKQRALYGKPVVGWVECAASAGYWIAASVCDVLFGGATAVAGSIGTYVPHESIAGLLAKEGREITLIADPPGKVAGNPYEPLSDLGRARIDAGVKACTARFFAAIEAARGIPVAQLRELDGAVAEGEAAVTAGLLDTVSDLETTIDYALALADQGTALEAA